MKKLIMLGILTTLSLNANVEMGPGDKYTVDAYGDSWQKAPTQEEMDPNPRLFSTFSKKSSDITISPKIRY